jgi:hypothetical protein
LQDVSQTWNARQISNSLKTKQPPGAFSSKDAFSAKAGPGLLSEDDS